LADDMDYLKRSQSSALIKENSSHNLNVLVFSSRAHLRSMYCSVAPLPLSDTKSHELPCLHELITSLLTEEERPTRHLFHVNTGLRAS